MTSSLQDVLARVHGQLELQGVLRAALAAQVSLVTT